MTIDERVKSFEPFKDSAAWETYLRTLLLEVARDQRHACAEAINNCHTIKGEQTANIAMIPKLGAYQAVMNATRLLAEAKASPATEDRAAALWKYHETLGAQMSYIADGKSLICAIPNETWDDEALAQQRKNAKLVCDAANSYTASQKKIESLEAALQASEDRFLARTINVHGNLLIVRMTEYEAAMWAIRSARAALKGDS